MRGCGAAPKGSAGAIHRECEWRRGIAAVLLQRAAAPAGDSGRGPRHDGAHRHKQVAEDEDVQVLRRRSVHSRRGLQLRPQQEATAPSAQLVPHTGVLGLRLRRRLRLRGQVQVCTFRARSAARQRDEADQARRRGQAPRGPPKPTRGPFGPRQGARRGEAAIGAVAGPTAGASEPGRGRAADPGEVVGEPAQHQPERRSRRQLFPPRPLPRAIALGARQHHLLGGRGQTGAEGEHLVVVRHN
mmetsp:Transcript_54692/g.158871  ORF Transcript_54692/g.158871 Transcript_54692/m.158871 type:complete len:243 (-) Transcript_54692:280-1008(-)